MLQQRGRCNSCGTFDWQWPNEGRDSDVVADWFICYGCEKLENVVGRVQDMPPQHGVKYGFFERED